MGHWSRRRFVWTVAPLAAVLIASRIVVLRAIDSQPIGMIVQVVSIVISSIVLCVVLTWAAEHDRRHSRDD